MRKKINIYKPDLSPYHSFNQHIEKIEKYSAETTKLLFNSICNVLDLVMKKSHDYVVFKGKIIYNPKTKKPIQDAIS